MRLRQHTQAAHRLHTSRLALGQWTEGLLQHAAPVHGGSGHWDSCHTVLGGTWKSDSCCKLHTVLVLGSGSHTIRCCSALAHSTMGIPQYNAATSRGRGPWNSCCTLPNCLGVLGSGTLTTHCRTTPEPWAVELVHYIAAVLGDSGRWSSCNAPSHCLRAPRRGTCAKQCVPA